MSIPVTCIECQSHFHVGDEFAGLVDLLLAVEQWQEPGQNLGGPCAIGFRPWQAGRRRVQETVEIHTHGRVEHAAQQRQRALFGRRAGGHTIPLSANNAADGVLDRVGEGERLRPSERDGLVRKGEREPEQQVGGDGAANAMERDAPPA